MLPSNQKSRRFLGIQALRMIAAVMVVITHSTFYTSERLHLGVHFWAQGRAGVDIFFVISGFVMIYASQRLFTMNDGWKRFAVHRILRIVPLYWLVTTLKVVILLLTAHLVLHAELNWVTAFCSYFFLPSVNRDGMLQPLVGVGWTLNLEMLFYFLFASALFLRRNVFVYLGIVLTVLTVGSFFRKPGWPVVSFYLNSVVFEFYLGMLIAKACRSGRYLPKMLAAILLPVGFYLLLLPPLHAFKLPPILVSGIPAAMIVASVVSLEAIERWIPRWILYLGDASYAIYLIHPFVCPIPPTLLNHLHYNHPAAAVPLAIAVGVGTGCLLHQFVEVPVNQRLRVWADRRTQPAAVTA